VPELEGAGISSGLPGVKIEPLEKSPDAAAVINGQAVSLPWPYIIAGPDESGSTIDITL
jgi:hypothetical protein